MTKTIITIFILLSFQIGAFAQSYTTSKTASKKAVKLYLKANAMSRSNQGDKALKCYEKALKIQPDFIDAKIKWAGIKYDMGDNIATEKALKEVVALDPHYNTKLLYTLGFINKKQDDCKEANQYFQQYINAPKTRTSLVAKAKKAMADCDFISQNTLQTSTNFNPIPLNENINTKNREYFPSLSADGNTFFFTRVERGQEDIYMSQKDEQGEWGRAELVPNINTHDNEGNQSISADGKTIVFTACNRRNTGYGSCDLYISKFKNGKWTPVQNMGRGINSPSWESQPSISADGNTLFFTTKRGQNGSDIYYSKQNEEGAWSVAKPIKGLVNTKGNEETPFIHPDGQTLYFKSNGHSGFGGFDIFYARLQADGTWGQPVNMGKPINSKWDEGGLIVSLDGKTAYFDSDKVINREGASKELNPNLHDIYYFELDEKLRPLPVTYVKAIVVDAVTQEPLEAQVEFIHLERQSRHAYNQTDIDGTFLVCLPYGKNYGLNVSKTGYLFHSENFALTNDDKTEIFEIKIELQAIPPAVAATPTRPSVKPTPTVSKPQPIILKNIFFATGSAQLKSSSFSELNRLHDLLVTNPKMNIQINGHTDNVGADTDNLKLSNERAKSVYNYLVQKGIYPSRLKYKGFGESQPIDTNDTPEGRRNNRRTEFLVL